VPRPFYFLFRFSLSFTYLDFISALFRLVFANQPNYWFYISRSRFLNLKVMSKRSGISQLNRLWIARQENGLRQKSVARLLGHKSTSVISEYETGKQLPSLPIALKLAAIYNRRIRDLYPELFQTVMTDLQSKDKRFN